MVQLQRLLQDEPGLRHGSLGGVHQKDYAVHHFENALHLAAEIGVTGGVNDVDFDVLIVYRRVFGKNGDAALALQVSRVHHAGHCFLIIPENAALF